jgi:hypothetical protein
MTVEVFTPWSSAKPLAQGAAPSWLPAADADRVQAYETFERMYWNERNTFKLLSRGTNEQPIYIPNPRIIVDTVARYVAKQLGFVAQPMEIPGQPAPAPAAGGQAGAQTEATVATQWFRALFNREVFFSNFHASKLYGIMQGDYAFHILANPLKPEGRRLTIRTVNPGNYFPIYDDQSDPESLRAVRLADVLVLDKEYVRVQEYRKISNDDGTAQIQSSMNIFAPDKWTEEGADPETVEGFTPVAPFLLDDRIQAIPVYHVRNNPKPNQPFGNSELRGSERLAAAVNQSISDEELVLVLEGLGVYATDAGPPEDEEGNTLNWILGPGRVVELNSPEARFMRVNGVSTVGPFQDHLKYIDGKMGDATGVNDASTGKVDVQVAESGIALALRLSPLLSRVEYYDMEITGKLTQMWFDIATGWLPVYEGADFPGVQVMPTLGSKLPVNRKEKVGELNEMLRLGVITTEYYLAEMEKLGYQFPDGIATMAAAAKAEQAERTALATPADEQRADTEVPEQVTT